MVRPTQVEGGAPSSEQGSSEQGSSEQGSSKQESYVTESIQVLDGLEAVRRRPGMYLGNVQDGSALHHVVWELVANVVDQHLAQRARRLSVDVRDGWIEVADDAGGIPIETHPRHHTSTLERVLTTLHAGPTRWGHHPHVHVAPTLHGVGLAAVNAVSERLEVEVRRGGSAHRMAFERGRVVSALERVGPSEATGTRIRLRPDTSIFAPVRDVDPRVVEHRLREIAWLCPLLEVRWQGRVLPGKGGIAEWALSRAERDALLVKCRRTIDDAELDLAITWRRERARPVIDSFVSYARTRDGGTHVQGLWAGLFDIAHTLAPDRRAANVLREQLGAGMVAVVHVGLFAPHFGGPTRDQLHSPVARDATRRAVREALGHTLAREGTKGPLHTLLCERLAR